MDEIWSQSIVNTYPSVAECNDPEQSELNAAAIISKIKNGLIIITTIKGHDMNSYFSIVLLTDIPRATKAIIFPRSALKTLSNVETRRHNLKVHLFQFLTIFFIWQWIRFIWVRLVSLHFNGAVSYFCHCTGGVLTNWW